LQQRLLNPAVRDVKVGEYAPFFNPARIEGVATAAPVGNLRARTAVETALVRIGFAAGRAAWLATRAGNVIRRR